MKEDDFGDFKSNTKLVKLGRADAEREHIINPPIYRTSTIIHPTLHDLKNGINIHGHWTNYARIGGPSTFMLEDLLSNLFHAKACLLTSSGLSAISLTLLGLLSQGDHLLVTDSVYGPVRFFCDNILSKKGIHIEYYSPTIGADIAQYIRPETKVIYMEQPGSLTFDVQDVGAICAVAKKHGIKTVVDTTWCTFLFYDAFHFGVDVVIQSLTKYLSGHADLIMGCILFREEDDNAFSLVHMTHRAMGICVSPDDIYLVQRGVRSAGVRLEKQMRAGINIALWLQERSEIKRILHPALPSHPQHEIWKRDFSGASGLFSFVLSHYSDRALGAMVDTMRLFSMGQSWGGYESLWYPILDTDTIRSVHPYKKDGQLIRIHIGLEDLDDLKHDLDQGFMRWRKNL